MINYQRAKATAGGDTAADFSEFQKYENSKQYKNVLKLMELDEDNNLKEIDSEIHKFHDNIQRNEAKLIEL